ncbi:MAG: hypothetical protein M3O15_01085 [Acidobacteriota bacterium]|nr:hypothetical protein [Acidobacteriota bacterium]
MQRILILTEADDFHAVAVAEALQRKGGEVLLWATSDFPSRTDESVHYNGSGRKISITGSGLQLCDPCFDVVWRRRPAFVSDPESVLHPADRAFAEGECGVFRRSFLHLISPDAFWVNPIEGAARAGSKLLQHDAACRLGLQVPETLFSNSPTEIRTFLLRRGELVYKAFSPVGWKTSDRCWLPFTARLTEESLVSDKILRLTPGIFQEVVPKLYELRVTVIGHRLFAARIFSQETERGKLDWRKSYDELRLEPATIPPLVADQCFALLDELGLVFGCFDFVVTPAGEHIFLEVNEMGQFLFVERYCALPLLDAFSEFLLQGTGDFGWSEDAVSVRYGDPEFEAAAMARSQEFLRSHVKTPETFTPE